MRCSSSAKDSVCEYKPLDKHALRQRSMWDEDGHIDEVLAEKPCKVDVQGGAPPPVSARPVLLGRCHTEAAPKRKKPVMVWGPDGELMAA
jgi:hypothetical protein